MEKTQLIFKVLSKEATVQEVNELEAWIDSDPINKCDYEDLKVLWEGHTGTLYSSGVLNDDGFQRIKMAIRKNQKKKKITYIVSIGFLLITFFIVIYFFIKHHQEKSNNKVALTFKHVTLSQITSTFKEKYHVLLDVPAHLRSCEFTGVVYNDSPKDALKFITESLNLEFLMLDQQSFKVQGQACN